MAGRYLVSGVQLGMLIVMDDHKEREKAIHEILDAQYVDSSDDPLMWDIEHIRKSRAK